MNIIEIDPTTDRRWCDLITRRESVIFHTPQWLTAIRETYQFEMRALLLVEAGQPVAGVAFARVDDAFGARLAVLPFSDFGDALVDCPEHWQLLSDALVAKGMPIKLRTLYNDLPLTDDNFEQVDRARWHGIDLTGGRDALWSHLHGSARRAVRKAQKAVVTVRFGRSLDDMLTFYRLHVGIRKHKYGMVAQPQRFFEQIWRQLVATGNGYVALAEHDGEVIGATLFLIWQGTLTYKFNASKLGELKIRPNDLIIWTAIERACEQGLTRFDFGLSDWDQEGLVRYKRKFATEEKTIHFLKHTPDDWEPTAAQSLRGLFPQLTNLFTDAGVSDEVTARAGDLLYRYFI